jgi:prepilin-type N-terminal cleavage/methylation domain-containing protein
MNLARLKKLRKPRAGMTLIEVVIALALAGMLSAGMYGSAIYTMRQTAKNVEHIFAVQLASSEAACVRASRFDKLAADPADLTTTDFEKRFTTPRTVVMDPNNPKSQTFSVKYKLTGFGAGVELIGGGPHAKLWLPEQSNDWAKDQYADHLLVITGGSGVNQVMRIVSNQKSVKTGSSPDKKVEANLTSDLTGVKKNEKWLGTSPGTTSLFAVDYGLYCDIEVSWDDGAGYKTVKETVYVPNSQ